MRNYNKYKKYGKKRKMISPLKITAIIIGLIIVMSIGYASFNDTVQILGTAKIVKYTITYNLNGGTNPPNTITEYDSTMGALLPLATRSNYNFAGWYENEDCLGERIDTTPMRIKCKGLSIICEVGIKYKQHGCPNR